MTFGSLCLIRCDIINNVDPSLRLHGESTRVSGLEEYNQRWTARQAGQ